MNLRKHITFSFRSLSTKLIMISLMLLCIPSITVGVISYMNAKEEMNNSAKIQLKNDVNLVISTIELLNKEVEKGNITLEEAQESVKEKILGPLGSDGKRPINKDIDLGEHGYFYILDGDGMLLAHPNIEGDSLWDVVLEDGRMLGQELVKLGRNNGGYLIYDWPLPNSAQVASKITYSKMETDWGWIVVVGSYMSDYNSGANRILESMAITLLVSVIVGIIVMLFFVRRITRPINRITEYSKRVASGDLTLEELKIQSRDELGQLTGHFNAMVINLKRVISQVNSSADRLTASAEQLSAGADQTGKATEQITLAIQEVSSGSEQQVQRVSVANRTALETSQGLETISASIQSVAGLSDAASNEASLGNDVVNQAVHQMNEVQQQVQNTTQVVNILGEKSNEIGEIVSLITEISNQTNLLALNAAIEAARAGEHGRGFAVVAGEVRKLAEQSGAATEGIRELIGQIQKEIAGAVESMHMGQRSVNEGIRTVNQTGDAFKRILKMVEEVSLQSQEAAAIVQQVNDGTKDMVHTMEMVSVISQEAAGNAQSVAAAAEEQLASMEEITSSAQTLSGMAEELQDVIRKFKM
ncbi:methyl-accepting chemotaxis protein [Paenibacillus abyssi]|uniref:Chemotaxis protein n=1 Tax=Paenibacillus abyssi TaxID=1340531 RepID=A0A917CVS1_9BACL|nr:methyl-accepting chemotaxis protein [Paenibacillus abyssi]GGF99280.1 chemotaxis protein [Paenibacillus abyssi]